MFSANLAILRDWMPAMSDENAFRELSSKLKTAVDECKAIPGQVEARLTDIEQRLVRRPGAGGIATKSLGERFIEDSKVRDFLGTGERRGMVGVSMERKTITSAAGSGGGLVAPDWRTAEPIPLPQQSFAIRDLLAPGVTSSNTIYYARVTARINNAAPVAEGALKPQSDLTFDDAQAPVRTLAHWFKTSRQIMDDAPGLGSMIDNEARYGLALVEEQQFLYGDGTGQNLTGIVPQATAFNPAIYSIPSATNIDIIQQAIVQSQMAMLPATGIVMNYLDWSKILTTKDGQGRYIVGNPLGTIPTMLWGLPVVASLSMTPGTFLVGNFAQNVQVFDRMTVEVLLSTEDQDNFVKNMITIRAEERLALIVKRPQAIIRGSFPT